MKTKEAKLKIGTKKELIEGTKKELKKIKTKQKFEKGPKKILKACIYIPIYIYNIYREIFKKCIEKYLQRGMKIFLKWARKNLKRDKEKI